MRYLKPELLNHLAGAYVLGTLSGRARLRFEKLMYGHPAIKRVVVEWEKRLMPFASSVAPVTPPKSVWKAIDARLGATQKKSWFENFNFRNRSAQLALGVLIGLGIIQLLPKESGVPESYVGLLTGTPGAAPTMQARAMNKEQVLIVKVIEPVALEAGHHLVLWGLSKNNTPKRIGIIPAPSGQSSIVLAANADIVFNGITNLAVSIEPDGMENSTAPIGDIVRSGPIMRL